MTGKDLRGNASGKLNISDARCQPSLGADKARVYCRGA